MVGVNVIPKHCVPASRRPVKKTDKKSYLHYNTSSSPPPPQTRKAFSLSFLCPLSAMLSISITQCTSLSYPSLSLSLSLSPNPLTPPPHTHTQTHHARLSKDMYQLYIKLIYHNTRMLLHRNSLHQTTQTRHISTHEGLWKKKNTKPLHFQCNCAIH